MAHRDDVLAFMSDLLDVGGFEDYGPQGLQVQGRPDVARLVSGVSASAALFEAAREVSADMLLVHHGMLWDRDPRVVKGALRRRLKLLLDADITLAAYHLCLDAHPIVGNNALAADALGLSELAPWGEVGGRAIGIRGRWDGMPLDDALARIRGLYGGEPLVFPFGPQPVHTVGVISGGAQRDVVTAIDDGLDMFITGEASEFVMQTALEGGIHFVAAGHYRTERLGIKALGALVAEEFGLTHEFIDLPNPV